MQFEVVRLWKKSLSLHLVWFLPSLGKQLAPCLQSAVIHITIEFMNLKCNFPVVLRLLAPSTTWTVTSDGKKNMHGSVCEREGEYVCVHMY